MKLKLWLLGMASLLMLSGCLFEEDGKVDYGENAVFYFSSYNHETYGYIYAPDAYYTEYCSMKGFCGNIIDERDNQSYGWVLINNTKWLQRDLDYATPNSYCRDGLCDYYGRKYSWAEAMNLDSSYNTKHFSLGNEDKRGICPEGWRLPRIQDFALVAFNSLYILQFDVNKRDGGYYFNPDSLYRYKDKDKLNSKIKSNQTSINNRGYIPLDFFASEQWPNNEDIDNPYSMGLKYWRSIRMMITEEDPNDPSRFMTISKGTESYLQGVYYVSKEKKPDENILDRELLTIRCVQDITYDEAQQIWIDAFKDKWEENFIVL